MGYYFYQSLKQNLLATFNPLQGKLDQTLESPASRCEHGIPFASQITSMGVPLEYAMVYWREIVCLFCAVISLVS
jgi:hypothetical protein